MYDLTKHVKNMCFFPTPKFYIVYVLHCFDPCTNEQFFKVGITYRTAEKRFRSTRCMPYEYSIIFERHISNCRENEKLFHSKYIEHSYLPLIKFGGWTECYNINPINKLKDLLN